MPVKKLLLLVAFCLPIAACGGADAGKLLDESQRSLATGDHAKALGGVEKALAGMDASAPRYVEAKVVQARALAYSDAARSQQEFLGLVKSHKVAGEHYRSLVADLTTAGAYAQATAILEAGLAANPEDPKWPALLKALGDRVKESGDEGLLKALKGLGYI